MTPGQRTSSRSSMRLLSIICGLAGLLATVLALVLLGMTVIDLVVSRDEGFPGRG